MGNIEDINEFFGYYSNDWNPPDSFKKVISEYEGRLGRSVLDVACGGGKFSFYLSSLGFFDKVVGIDIDPNSIEFARNHNSNQNLTFYEADILKYEFEQTYDTIFFLGNSIGHFSMEKMKILVEKAYQILEEEGYFIVELVTPFQLEPGKIYSSNTFSEEIIESNLEEGKLKLKFGKKDSSVETDVYIWYPFMLNYICKEKGLRLDRTYQNGQQYILVFKKEDE